MATYVLVHGGGHGGWCYQRVARMLRSAGHDVYTPTMTGLGERAHLVSPRVDLDMHIRDVTATLHHEDLREVILVGHSYGGMVITGAADRAADRVGRIVYLDAANPRRPSAAAPPAERGALFRRAARATLRSFLRRVAHGLEQEHPHAAATPVRDHSG